MQRTSSDTWWRIMSAMLGFIETSLAGSPMRVLLRERTGFRIGPNIKRPRSGRVLKVRRSHGGAELFRVARLWRWSRTLTCRLEAKLHCYYFVTSIDRSRLLIDSITYLRSNFLCNVIMLTRGALSHCDRVAAPVADLAGAIRRLLRSTESARGAASLRDGLAQRQSPQVDGSDVGASERSGHVSSVSALHHACAVADRRGVETAARGGAGTARRVDFGRHKFPQTRHGVGRRRASVLRRTRQDGELPSGRHGGAVDRRPRVVVGRPAL